MRQRKRKEGKRGKMRELDPFREEGEKEEEKGEEERKKREGTWQNTASVERNS